jgi:hypothetical protein
MVVDRKWALRNLGFDPAVTPPPEGGISRMSASAGAESPDLQREIIDFDSESVHGQKLLAFSRATGLSRYIQVDWPKGLDPRPSKSLHPQAGQTATEGRHPG